MNPKRDEWLSHLLSSEPVNRPKAESALRDLYAATGLPAPNYFFWFDSPFKTVLAMILLTAVKDSFMRQMVAGLERIATERELLVVVREEMLRASSQPNWDLLARVTGESLSTGVTLSGPMPASGGPPYEISVSDLNADSKLLNERHDLYFVDYLRTAFRFGGFPGYDVIDPAPKELSVLNQGLVSF